jgi:hypothetical protein
LTRHSGVSQELPAGVGLGVADVLEAPLLELDDDEFTFVVNVLELPAEPADDEFPLFGAELFAFLAPARLEFMFAVGFESELVVLVSADELLFDNEFPGEAGLFFAYSAAAATSESCMARSVDNTRTRAIVSTFSAIVSNNPNTSMIN